MKTLKNLLMLFAVVAGSSTFVSAQKIAASKVPSAVKASFAKVYPSVSKVSWEKEKGKYEAGFELKQHEMSALFNANGKVEETEIEIKVSELPSTVLNYVKTNYKGVKIAEAARITKADGEVNYEAEIKGKDLLFDTKGILLNR